MSASSLNRPELTARHFIPNPFAVDGNALMYRTGDLSRLNDDDEFEFLGRIDQQVKLRGYQSSWGRLKRF